MFNNYNIQPMVKKLNYTEWHLHIARELEKDYRKLKLTKNENIQRVLQPKPEHLRGIQESSIQPNK